MGPLDPMKSDSRYERLASNIADQRQFTLILPSRFLIDSTNLESVILTLQASMLVR